MNTNTLFFSSYSASEMTFLKHSVWKKSCLLPYFSFISFILNPHREARRFSLSGSPGKRFQFVSRTQNLKGQKVVNLNKDHCYTQVFLMHSPSVTVSKKAKQRKNVKQCSRDNSFCQIIRHHWYFLYDSAMNFPAKKELSNMS